MTEEQLTTPITHVPYNCVEGEFQKTVLQDHTIKRCDVKEWMLVDEDIAKSTNINISLHSVCFCFGFFFFLEFILHLIFETCSGFFSKIFVSNSSQTLAELSRPFLTSKFFVSADSVTD